MLLVAVFTVLGIADITATAVLIFLGMIEEWNPLLLWFLRGGGLANMILFKMCVHTLGTGMIALSIQRGWITPKRASVYTTAGIVLFLAGTIPAYAMLLFV